MAKDLLFGQLARDWSCGAYPFTSPAKQREDGQDVLAATEVGPLAALVDKEVFRNIQTILHLQTTGKISVADRRAYGKFVARWQDFYRPREGKFEGPDYVALANFRDENRLLMARISTSAKPSPAAPPPVPPAADPHDAGHAGLRLVKHSALAALGAVVLARLYESRAKKHS